MFTYHRFTTTIYDRAGEGRTLYAGGNLGEAIRAARGVKTGRYEIVKVTDWNKVDGPDNHGEVCLEDFAEDRPARDTDPGSCRWCYEEAFGQSPCPYHGEQVQGDERR